jgi:hypothetical protein
MTTVTLASLRADVARRWELLVALEATFDAARFGDIRRLKQLREQPLVREALRSDPVYRLEALAACGASRSAELVAEAVEEVRREPALARASLGLDQTLLHRAAAAWCVPLVEALLEEGAPPNAFEAAGHPPLYYAGNQGVAGRDDDAAELVAVFSRYGADLDATGGVMRCTPLHMAARRGHVALAAALVAHGADIDARDARGDTPLRRALNCRKEEVARALRALGAR